LLTKAPVPEASLVLKLVIVGPVVNDQQTPLPVTVPPPFVRTFPPDTAVVAVIDDIGAVVRVANDTEVAAKEISFP
jgi:hypothetical protein